MEVRARLLVAGLTEECGAALAPGQEDWLVRWSGGHQRSGEDQAEAQVSSAKGARDRACPKGRKLWEQPLSPGWNAKTDKLWSKCKVEKLGLLTAEEFRTGDGPEAGLLGSVLYDELRSSDEAHARTLGRWIAGHPADPRDGLSRQGYGTVGVAADSVSLIRSTSEETAYSGCAPVIAIGPERLEVDGKPLTLETLDDGLKTCRTLEPRREREAFKGRTLLAVDGATPYRRVLDVMAVAGHLHYFEFQILVGGAAPHDASGAILQRPGEYDRIAVIDTTLPPLSRSPWVVPMPIELVRVEPAPKYVRPDRPPAPTPATEPEGRRDAKVSKAKSRAVVSAEGRRQNAESAGALGSLRAAPEVDGVFTSNLNSAWGGIGGLIGARSTVAPPKEDEAPRLRLHIHVTKHENIVSDGIGGEYRVTDVAALHAHLLEIKKNWPDDQTMTLTADDDVPFARVVQVLDHSRYGIEALGAPPSKRGRPEDLFSYVALGAKSTD